MVHLIFHSFLDNWPKVPTITAQRCSERTLCSSLPFVKVMTDGETGQNRANKELWSNLSFRILCNSRKQKQEAWIRNKIIFNVLFLQIYLSLEIFLEKKKHYLALSSIQLFYQQIFSELWKEQFIFSKC